MSTATASSAKACLRLVVKTANHQCSDLNVDCDCNCNVRDLKLQLAKLHPITPPASQQRLVYAGRLLADHLKLSDILDQSDGSCRVALHLVLSPYFQRSVSSPASQNNEQKATSTTPPCPPSGTSFIQSPVSEQVGVRQRGAPYTPTSVPFSYLSNVWMHSAYMQQMAAAAAASGHAPPVQTSPFNPSTSRESSPSPASAPASAPAPAARERVNEERPANNRQVINANAAGGLMDQDDDDDEAVARDWLDKIYMMFRAGLLVMIFYFYSSSFHFSLAIIIIVLIFLYQSGWLTIQRRARVQAAQNNRDNGNPQADQGSRPAGVAPEGEAFEVEQRPGVLATLLGFFTAFFTSLIPQNPQALVGN